MLKVGVSYFIHFGHWFNAPYLYVLNNDNNQCYILKTIIYNEAKKDGLHGGKKY